METEEQRARLHNIETKLDNLIEQLKDPYIFETETESLKIEDNQKRWIANTFLLIGLGLTGGPLFGFQTGYLGIGIMTMGMYAALASMRIADELGRRRWEKQEKTK